MLFNQRQNQHQQLLTDIQNDNNSKDDETCS
jgi:hypothetical protein